MAARSARRPFKTEKDRGALGIGLGPNRTALITAYGPVDGAGRPKAADLTLQLSAEDLDDHIRRCQAVRAAIAAASDAESQRLQRIAAATPKPVVLPKPRIYPLGKATGLLLKQPDNKGGWRFSLLHDTYLTADQRATANARRLEAFPVPQRIVDKGLDGAIAFVFGKAAVPKRTPYPAARPLPIPDKRADI